MIKNLYHLMVFAKVVETGSFTAASDALGIGRSVVSSHLSQLERMLGTQLLIRSTRSLSMTKQGEILFESCARIQQELDLLSRQLDTERGETAGHLKLTCSVNVGVGLLSGIMTDFRALYPKVTVELVLEDRLVDVVGEGFDFAIRTGWKDDGRLRSISLPKPRILICAARQWTAQNAPVTYPSDLSDLVWIETNLGTASRKLKLQHVSGERTSVAVRPGFSTNAGLAAKIAIMRGAGVGLLPDFAIQEELLSGEIVPLLLDWSIERDYPMSIVVPNQQTLPYRTKLALDYIQNQVTPNLKSNAPRPSG